MCMFTAPVESVTETKIFARSLPEGRQIIVYRMALNTKQDVAMVLPIPVKAGSGEKAVQFVDLSGYSQLLRDLEGLFSDSLGAAAADHFADAEPTLEVQDVGAFEATYVPALADFAQIGRAHV